VIAVKHKALLYPIALKFGTLKGRIRAHPDIKFGCNAIKLFKGSDTLTNHIHLASDSTPNQLTQITNQLHSLAKNFQYASTVAMQN